MADSRSITGRILVVDWLVSGRILVGRLMVHAWLAKGGLLVEGGSTSVRLVVD